MGKHILFVDDDALLRRLVRDMLEQEGYKVSVASSGDEGLATARGQPPDLILVDVMMPGMDGFEMCQEIRRDHRLYAVPVVMLTAMKNPDLDERATAAGADMCLGKPFQPTSLLNAVTLALQDATRRGKRPQVS